MVIPKINSAHGPDTRNIINTVIDSINVHGKSIQELVVSGQLSPAQYAKLIQTVEGLISKGEVKADDLSPELLELINNSDGTPFDILSIPRDGSVSFEKADDDIKSKLFKLNDKWFNEYPEQLISNVSTSNRVKIIGEPIPATSKISRLKFESKGVGELIVGVFRMSGERKFVPEKFYTLSDVKVGKNEIEVDIPVFKNQYFGVWDVGGKILLEDNQGSHDFTYNGSVIPPKIGEEFEVYQSPNRIVVLSLLFDSIPTKLDATSKDVKEIKDVVGIAGGGYFNDYDGMTANPLLTGRTRIIDLPFEKDTVVNGVKLNAGSTGQIKLMLFERGSNTNFTQRWSTVLKINKTGENFKKVNIPATKGYYLGVYDNNSILTVTTDIRNDAYVRLGDTNLNVTEDFIHNVRDGRIMLSFMEKNILSDLKVLNEVGGGSDGGGIEIGGYNNPLETTKYKTQSGKRPLYIEDAYGYHQPYHPDVIDFKQPWNGWRYWMVHTPFPHGSSVYKARYENPHILVSHDGYSWNTPTGIKNPIDELTQGNINNEDYMSDPDFVYIEETETLEVWYRYTYGAQNNNTIICRKTTTDGINWSEREVMIDSWDTEQIRSQSVIWENNKYKMWYTGNRNPIGYGESLDGKSWVYQTCNFDISQNVWHLYADYDPTKENYFLITYFGAEQTNSYYESDDGINWRFVKDLLKAEEGTFYQAGLYRAAAVYTGEKWRLYFTAESQSNGSSKPFASLGLMEGDTLETMEVVDGGYNAEMSVFRQGIRLGTNDVYEAPIILADTGECLVFDNVEKALCFQRADGTRVVIAR